MRTVVMKMMMILTLSQRRTIAIRCYTDLEATQVRNTGNAENIFYWFSEQIPGMRDGNRLREDPEEGV